MPYADPEKQKAWYLQNREILIEKKKEYRKNNPGKDRESQIAYRKKNKKKIREYQTKYRAAYQEKNKERLRETARNNYRKNQAGCRRAQAAYKEKNRDSIRQYKKDWEKDRFKTHPEFRLRRLLRGRIRHALQGKNKTARTLELLGCSVEFLRERLENQFQPGMTWENYGPIWHVDHILPCAAFHLQHSEEQEICFHWTNLQPLFAAENLSKGDKII